MFAQFQARFAAVRSVAITPFDTRPLVLAAISAATLVLGGCLPSTVPLVGADPSDPSARVARVGYRSTVAPYTGLRPVTPSSWKGQNDTAPTPKSGQ